MDLDLFNSGSSVIDNLLCGGYEKDVITTIFGPAGSGKTTICIIAAISAIRSGKKVIYVDTEGGFSAERFRQISAGKMDLLSKIFFLKPVNFESQKDAIKKLKDIVDDSIGLIIVDTISMLYRVQAARGKEVRESLNELGLQISYLAEIARTKNIPVIITNQVYSDFDIKDNVKMVGGDILKYGSKCLIELVKNNSVRTAVLVKHRHLKENKTADFEIVDKGIQEIKENKKKQII